MTCIVGIRTPQIVVIAADSKGTFKGNGPETVRPVCKIFRVREAGFATAGLTKDPVRGFDLENIVAETLWHRVSISSAATRIGEIVVDLLAEELHQLKEQEPALYAKSLQEDYVNSVLIAAWEKGQPVASALAFKAQEDSQGQIQIGTSSLSCPGNCPGGVYTFFLGERRGINRYLAERGKNFGMSPEIGAPFLVGLEIEAESAGVGPPVDVLVVTGEGVRWLKRKDACADHPLSFKLPDEKHPFTD